MTQNKSIEYLLKLGLRKYLKFEFSAIPSPPIAGSLLPPEPRPSTSATPSQTSAPSSAPPSQACTPPTQTRPLASASSNQAPWKGPSSPEAIPPCGLLL